jgi:hypothetical protein
LKPQKTEPAQCKAKRDLLIPEEITVELIRSAFAKGAHFRFKVKGFSMSPFIRDDDIITLSPVCLSPAGLGKTVACLSPFNNKLLVHRVVGRKRGRYLIKGDNAHAPDFFTDQSHILGCVTAIERKNRPVSLGLGPERITIVYLSRMGVFSLISFLWKMAPGFLRRFIKCRVSL